MPDGTQDPKQKKNPVGEFLFYYVGTLTAIYVADQSGWLVSGRHGVDTLPPGLSLANVLEGARSDADTKNNLLFILIGIALVYPMHLWRTFVKSWFVPLATRGAGLDARLHKHHKFLEQAWLAVHYSVAVALEVYAIKTATKHWPPLATAASRDALPMPLEAVRAHHESSAVRAVYLLQFTFYFMELATLVMDRRSRSRSDAFVYAIHHVLTVVLIGFSYVTYCQQAGLLVLFCHDVGDIFLPIAKCFVYTEDHARVAYSRRTFKILEALGVFFFICFLVTFGFARLVLFPTLIWVGVYNSGWFARDFRGGESVDPGLQDPTTWDWMPEPISSGSSILTMHLLLLFPLHVYWFRCALRVAYRAVMGLYDDERSDDEDDDAPAAPAKQKTN